MGEVQVGYREYLGVFWRPIGGGKVQKGAGGACGLERVRRW
jgi:hypothetical protein